MYKRRARLLFKILSRTCLNKATHGKKVKNLPPCFYQDWKWCSNSLFIYPENTK